MNHPAVEQQITFLYTEDLIETAHFYEEIIGLKLVLDQETCRLYRICSGSYLGFCQKEGMSPAHDDIIFTLVTSKVNQWYQFLLRKGLTLEKLPTKNPTFNIYHFTFRDPNGYLVEIQQFLDPTWE
jgi:catechol 2,3-dioxygenase-like lactoylglutathione lyase family enzyme